MRNTTLAAAITTGLSLLSVNVMADYSTTVGGKIFADMSHVSAQNNGTDVSSTGTGIDVKRFYLTVDHDFTDMWSANLTTDFNFATFSSSCSTNAVDSSGNPATCSATTTGTTNQVYVKKAYVQANVMPEAMFRLGSADLPWVPYAESDSEYGFRYIEPILIDRIKFGTSADWGAHFLGKANDGMFNYAAALVNGRGYKDFTRSKTMDLEGRLGFQPIKGVTLALGGYSGKLGQEIVGGPTYRTANRLNALVSFVQPGYRVGAEWFQANNWKIKTSAAEDKADGYSVWGSVSPMEKVTLFARYDTAKPNKDTSPDLKDKYYNFGLQYEARKNVNLAVVYKHDTVDGGALSTANGTIGSTTGSKSGKFSEIGLYTQVKF
jgi:hypothetical protein